MKLILIGMDASAFRQGSYLRKRLVDYAKECESITALIATGDKSVNDFSQGNLAVKPVRSPFKPFSFFKLVSAGISEARRLGDPKNVVITSQDAFFLGFAAWLVSAFSGAKLHVQVHVEFFSPFYRRESLKDKIHYRLARFLLPRAARIRVVSKKIGDHCVRELRIPKEKIDVIPLLVDVEKIKELEKQNGNAPAPANASFEEPPQATAEEGGIFQQKNARAPRKNAFAGAPVIFTGRFSKTILMACRLSKQKNIPLALRALKRLPSDVGLRLVGKGEEEAYIKECISKLDLGSRVVMMPWNDDVPSLMRSADVFLISSDYEGYVMTAMEASVCGLPIVMTDVGGAREFVLDGVNGLVVPIGDEKALAAALGKVLNDDSLRQKLISGARQRSAGLPSYEKYIHSIVESWKETERSVHKV